MAHRHWSVVWLNNDKKGFVGDCQNFGVFGRILHKENRERGERKEEGRMMQAT
ncbi:hypothetical protein PanWU01x14_081560, partial [Parasponia andersonii]